MGTSYLKEDSLKLSSFQQSHPKNKIWEQQYMNAPREPRISQKKKRKKKEKKSTNLKKFKYYQIGSN
jgi:hypothetical protein